MQYVRSADPAVRTAMAQSAGRASVARFVVSGPDGAMARRDDVLTTHTSACAGSASASGPGVPVAQPEGRVAPTAGEARTWSRSRHDANGRATLRGRLPLGSSTFEAKSIDRQAAHPGHARQNSAGGRDPS